MTGPPRTDAVISLMVKEFSIVPGHASYTSRLTTISYVGVGEMPVGTVSVAFTVMVYVPIKLISSVYFSSNY